MALLSILIGSRKGSNPHSNLEEFLASIALHVEDRRNVEVLIKLDEDDPGLNDALKAIRNPPDDLTVKFIITPRAKGFFDLHKAYNDLMLLLADDSRAVWVLSDDARLVANGIDTALMPRLTGQEGSRFWIAINPDIAARLSSITYEMSFYHVESYPCWSRALLEVCGGLPIVPSSDTWSMQLIRMMQNRYGINIYLTWPIRVVQRMVYEGDNVHGRLADMPPEQAERVRGIRSMHENIAKESFQRILRQNAHSLFLNMMSEQQFGDPADPAFHIPKRTK